MTLAISASRADISIKLSGLGADMNVWKTKMLDNSLCPQALLLVYTVAKTTEIWKGEYYK